MAGEERVNVSQYLMTEGNIHSKIIRFAVPVFIGHFFQQMYNTVDSLIVGNLINAEALAAVASTASYIYLMTAFFMGFAMGAGVVIARHIGARDDAETGKAVHTAVGLGLVFSLLMTLCGIFLSPVVLGWMGTPENVMDQASRYLRVYFSGSVAIVMYNVFVGILQAAGDSKHPLVYLVISSVTNIALDLLFIGVFHMGVEGAALATVFSQILSMVLVARLLLTTRESFRLRPRAIRFDRDNMRQIFRYGIPTALQGCVIDLSNMLIQSYINSFGSQAMAGLGASSKIEGFAFLPVTAFSMALTTFISQNMGAQRKERIREGMRFGLGCTAGMLLVTGALMHIFAPQLITLFNREPEIIAYGVTRTRICALFYCLVGFSHTASAVARGLGKPMTPMVVMLVCWCFVRVAVLLTIGRVWHDIRLVCWIYPFTWTLSTIVYVVYLNRTTKRMLNPLTE